jgi:hypothetical protein
VWLLRLGKNELDFPLREEESLHSLYFWEHDAFHEVVSDVAPRSCRGPHALECDANILSGLRAHRRSGNELLNHLGIEVLHRVLTKKRNKMLPNVSSIVNCRGIPILTQHFRFPVLGEVCELGRWHWPIGDLIDVCYVCVESPLRQTLCWIIFESPDYPVSPRALSNTVYNYVFTPSPMPTVLLQPQLSFLIPLSCHRVPFAR